MHGHAIVKNYYFRLTIESIHQPSYMFQPELNHIQTEP